MKKPINYLLVGFPYSGKTTLAKELEKRLGFARINIDDLKFARGYTEMSDDDVPDSVWDEIFLEADRLLVDHLKQGRNVANENAWISRDWRDRTRNIAKDAGFETKIIWVRTPEAVVRERLLKNRESKKRFDVTDKIMEEAIRDFEEPTDEKYIVYDQHISIDDLITRYFI